MDWLEAGQYVAADREARAVALGREIFALAKEAPSGESWWDRKVMGIGMADEGVKAQLFRLVDVLPVLSSAVGVNRHLREYLAQLGDRLPWPAREALGFFPTDGLFGKVLARMTLRNTRRMARRFIAASDAKEAVAAARELRQRRMTFTIDLLGEAVLSASEALAYQRYYLNLVETLANEANSWREDPLIDRDHLGPTPKVNVSVKLSSLYSQFDPIDPAGTSAAVRERLRPILLLAKQRGVFVNFDMEQYSYKELTIGIFKEILEEVEFRDWGDVGIAIQAYLRSSGDDLKGLANWAAHRGTAVWVRLVKGAYWDYERIVARQNDWPIPVYDHKAETDANYEEQSRFLIERFEVLRPAIASHNIRSISAALAFAEEKKLPRGAMEFQLLYGMADPIKEALIKLGQRVRVYAPVGALLPGMAYLVRRLLENTSNESFLRAGFLEHVSQERLLMNPQKLVMEEKTTKDRKDKGRQECLPHRNGVAGFRNEPLMDFSREEARMAMGRALEDVRRRLGVLYPLVIDGRRVETGGWIESVNPSHKGQLVGRVAAGRAEEAKLAVGAAKRAFAGWRDTPADARAELLLRAAAILRRRRFELMAWEVFETGKPWREADGDVAEAIDYCEYYAREMMRLAQPRHKDVPGEENQNLYEPRGVAVVIAPWNFPLAILLGMTTAALVTGNTVVMKPAEQSAVIGAKFMEVLEEAGFPPGVVNLLNGAGEEVGPTLVNHPDVAIIAFTGSRPVGLMIQQQAALVTGGQEHLKRVITELGGKNAVIVDDDADLDEAVHGVAASAFGYAGQKCSACSRVIVLSSIYDAFVNRLVEATKSLKVGPAEEAGSFVGPVIDGEAYERILALIKRFGAPALTLPSPGVPGEGSKEQAGRPHHNEGEAQAGRPHHNGNGRLAYGGDVGALKDEGFYIGPHIFADVSPDSPLAQEEIFGPVLAVIRAKDLDEALSIANGTKYALTGGLFSRSPSTIERVRREFRVGNLYINRKITGALVERQPFGGFKLSGVGTKAGGPDYLVQFMWPRTITENTMRRGFAPPEDGAAGGM